MAREIRVGDYIRRPCWAEDRWEVVISLRSGSENLPMVETSRSTYYISPIEAKKAAWPPSNASVSQYIWIIQGVGSVGNAHKTGFAGFMNRIESTETENNGVTK